MNISASSLIEVIRKNDFSLFTTADVVTLASLSRSAATHALNRLAAHGLLKKIKRGLWANALRGDVNPYEAVTHLTAPWTSYISLHSALSDAGVIEEIPHVVYGVTAGRPRRYETPIGRFHVHHLPEHLMWGFEMRRIGQRTYPMAEPEKAFLDLAYLSLIPRSRLRMPQKRSARWTLDKKTLRDYAVRFRFPPLLDLLKKHRLW